MSPKGVLLAREGGPADKQGVNLEQPYQYKGVDDDGLRNYVGTGIMPRPSAINRLTASPDRRF